MPKGSVFVKKKKLRLLLPLLPRVNTQEAGYLDDLLC
jgi:hypothetical protein